jgi:tRNA threonylcarbamoyladenosine biosynthesis protein TsaE
MLVLDLPDEAATAAFAERVAALARRGDVIALRGDLGVGKTSFARSFIRSCGNPDEEVPSPTFTLVQFYEPGVWHFDLYRLVSPEEAWELGIEEAFTQGISLVEWPERLGPLLPPRRLDIALAYADGAIGRRAYVSGGAEWQARLDGLLLDA